MNDAAPRHPEDHIMAAFIDGTLAPDEIAEVAAHLRQCADCRTVVTETARLERDDEAGRGGAARWWWLAAAAALALLLAAPLYRWNEQRRDPIAHLIALAPRQHRTVAARLSGFPWALLQAPSRGRPAQDPADLKLSGAAGEVLERTAGATSAESQHARGLSYLLIGDGGASIAALQQAANQSKDARVWNDLAAARLALAEEQPSQLPEALAAAERALQLDPKLAEGHFNRALILERIDRDEARREWQRYLQIDPSSEWSNEARERLRKLDSKSERFDRRLFETLPAATLVQRFPQEARTWGEATLLGEWGDAEMKHDDAAASKRLALVRGLGAALAARGEHLLADAVAAIDRARPAARAALAHGHRAYDDAKRVYSTQDHGRAEQQFRGAADELRRAGSPMADVARYFAASAAFNQHRGAEAREELAQLLSTIDRVRYRALDAQIQWQLATVANADGDYGAGVRNAEAAVEIFRSLGESFNAAFADCVAAHAFDMIGASDAAWERRLRAFPTLAANRPMFDGTLHSAAETIGALGEVAAAQALMNVVIADEAGQPARLASAYATRSGLDARAGDAAGGARAVAEGRAAANRVKDAALREALGAQLDLAEATLRVRQEPHGAIAALDRSIALFAKGRLRKLLPDAYLQRARAGLAAGDSAAAEADYAAALREIEAQRDTIGDAELRLRFLDVASQIVEEAIELHLARGRAAEAFAIADRTRALFERQTPAAARPMPRSGQAIVEYAVLPHSIAIFCATAEGIGAKKVEIEREQLAARVASLAEKIRGRARPEQIESEAAALYALLIAPLQPRLASFDELVVVPDRELHGVPFAALYDAASRRYLAEEVTIRIAPSAAAPAAVPDASLKPALVVADPAAAHWPRLPASGSEAEAIAAAYGTAPLRGEAATRASFVAAAKESALIHFAGHADSDVHASYAALLFAPAAGDSGILGAAEISRLALARRPLVVLAACGTFRGSAAHVAGMPSLGRAFLLAGARGVVGTLWEIDDDVSAPLFLRIHDHLRAGTAPARAVRAAQVEMIHASDPRLRHPATWAPVTFLSNSL